MLVASDYLMHAHFEGTATQLHGLAEVSEQRINALVTGQRVPPGNVPRYVVCE